MFELVEGANILSVFFLGVALFFSRIIDAVAGGGGLISLPAFFSFWTSCPYSHLEVIRLQHAVLQLQAVLSLLNQEKSIGL